MENLRKCKVVAEKEYRGAIYYKAVTDSGKEYIFKEKEGNLLLVNHDKCSKIFQTKTSNKIVKNLFMPLILTTMITTSLSGCSKNNKETSNDITNIESNDLNGNLPSNEYDSEYTEKIYISDLEKYGIEYEDLGDKCHIFGGTIDVYKILNIDLSKVPMNEVFSSIPISFDIHDIDSFTLDSNVTWDDAINLVNEKEIGEKYKKIIINAIEKMKTLSLDEGLPTLYNNIKNSAFLTTKTKAAAEFSQYYHQLIFGNVFIKDNKKTLMAIKKSLENGEITKEEYEEMLTQEEYIIPHELGHMLSLYYDDKTTKSIDIEKSYVLIDPNDRSIIGIVPIGRSLSDGFADYLTYEITGRKTSKSYGYPINQCIYLAYKKMLGINDIEELRTLNTEKLCVKLKEIGIDNPIDNIMTFDNIIQKDYSVMSDPYVQYDDFTSMIALLFTQYADVQINNGVEMTEIINVLNDIIQSYRDRIGITKKNGEEIIEAAAGYSTVSVTKLEEYINSLSDIKLYQK